MPLSKVPSRLITICRSTLAHTLEVEKILGKDFFLITGCLPGEKQTPLLLSTKKICDLRAGWGAEAPMWLFANRFLFAPLVKSKQGKGRDASANSRQKGKRAN